MGRPFEPPTAGGIPSPAQSPPGGSLPRESKRTSGESKSQAARPLRQLPLAHPDAEVSAREDFAQPAPPFGERSNDQQRQSQLPAHQSPQGADGGRHGAGPRRHRGAPAP